MQSMFAYVGHISLFAQVSMAFMFRINPPQNLYSDHLLSCTVDPRHFHHTLLCVNLGSQLQLV